MEGCKARLKAPCEAIHGRLMRETVCRRYVLRMVKEALKAQTTASGSPRPSKRHKPNSVSSLASPQRKFGRSDTLPTPKEHLNFDVGTLDDDIKQEEFSGSEPSASKTIPPVSPSAASLFGTIVPQDNSNIECPACAKSVPMARINDHLDSGCKSYLSSGKTASSSKSGQKDAWSKLLGGKKSGKEK
jgi:hypothetical protein